MTREEAEAVLLRCELCIGKPPRIFAGEPLKCSRCSGTGRSRERVDALEVVKDHTTTLAAELAVGHMRVVTVAPLLAAAQQAREDFKRIEALEPRPYEAFPADWREQIANCEDCQRYKDHPIQRGICDRHRDPLYARARHDEHEVRMLGWRAKDIAIAALAALERVLGQSR